MSDGSASAPQPAVRTASISTNEETDSRRQVQLGSALLAATLLAGEAQEPSGDGDKLQPRRRVVLVPGGSGQRRRAPRTIAPSTTPDLTADPPTPPGDAGMDANIQSELRAWMKDNATLLSNVSLLVSIAALALNLLPGESWLEPYLQALIFGAAFVLLLELQHQWPHDLQLHRVRSTAVPANHSWRMSAFAFLMQVATVLFVIWAVLTTPLILFPLTALVVVMLFRRFYFRRFGSRFAGVIGVVSLVLVLLLSEILMLITWAAITDQAITIRFYTDERATFDPAITGSN